MSASKQQKSLLTEDGELREAFEPITLQAAPQFCIHCGTANRGDAQFCRNCGRSMDDQDVDAELSGPHSVMPAKNKRDQQHWKNEQSSKKSRPEMTAGPVLLELVTLVVMAGLVYMTMRDGQWGLSIIILIAWVAVTDRRHSES